MSTYSWYSQLIKLSWAPTSWLFGPVWSVLYILISISFSYVFYKTLTGKLPWTLALPFFLNLIFNFAFTPLQFGLKNNYLALVDILLVPASLIWAIVVIYPCVRWVAYVQIPYLLWVSFTTILQISITYLNR